MYQVNFLPWRKKHITTRKRRFIVLTVIITILAIISCSYLAFLQYIKLQHLESNLYNHNLQQQQTEQLKLLLIDKQKYLEQLITQRQVINKYTQRNHALLELLQALPTITPTKSWLGSFKLLQNHLEIKAHSYHFQEMNKLVLQLENSLLLSQIHLKKLSRVKNLNHLYLSAVYQEEAHE